ncbi:hypothetical protein M758_UG143400 [Ceratodon purpureus]|nr:hypothetical protein M758_UG143400 [Ceratodon purpureus]
MLLCDITQRCHMTATFALVLFQKRDEHKIGTPPQSVRGYYGVHQLLFTGFMNTEMEVQKRKVDLDDKDAPIVNQKSSALDAPSKFGESPRCNHHEPILSADSMKECDFVDPSCEAFSVEDVFQFGPEFFGMPVPYHVQVAEVNSSVLTTLLLMKCGEVHSLPWAHSESLWDATYAAIFKFYMS